MARLVVFLLDHSGVMRMGPEALHQAARGYCSPDTLVAVYTLGSFPRTYLTGQPVEDLRRLGGLSDPGGRTPLDVDQAFNFIASAQAPLGVSPKDTVVLLATEPGDDDELWAELRQSPDLIIRRLKAPAPPLIDWSSARHALRASSNHAVAWVIRQQPYRELLRLMVTFVAMSAASATVTLVLPVAGVRVLHPTAPPELVAQSTQLEYFWLYALLALVTVFTFTARRVKGWVILPLASAVLATLWAPPPSAWMRIDRPPHWLIGALQLLVSPLLVAILVAVLAAIVAALAPPRPERARAWTRLGRARGRDRKVTAVFALLTVTGLAPYVLGRYVLQDLIVDRKGPYATDASPAVHLTWLFGVLGMMIFAVALGAILALQTWSGRLWIGIAGCLLVVVPIISVSHVRAALQRGYREASVLTAGGEMSPGDRISSPDGAYALDFQTDGNLVVYALNHRAIFSAGSNGASRVALQPDGNLVASRADGSVTWNAGTWREGTCTLAMQDDGNLVIYRADGTPAWNSGGDSGRTVDAPTQGMYIPRPSK